MSGFVVGEVAILQNAEFRHELNGVECVVLVAGERVLSARTMEAYIGYKVESVTGEVLFVAPHQLRKKRPPASDESAHRQAMLDCIERAKRPSEVEA